MLANKSYSLLKRQGDYIAHFRAMASPCEVIIETQQKNIAEQVANLVTAEVERIEKKYSRYLADSVCSQINNSQGQACAIDNETFLLLNFAEQCYQLSHGLFDITSGILAKSWQFDGRNCDKTRDFPSEKDVTEQLKHVGWPRVKYQADFVQLPQGMSIDFGGIAKEYAVDKAMMLATQYTKAPILINLGGDISVSGLRGNNLAWQVAIENPHNEQAQGDLIVSLTQGALATSGDSKRFILYQNKRYSHIINAKTGWPVSGGPSSITVAAPQCTTAGMLATLALLQGRDAEKMLLAQHVNYWARY